ncbi:MAG TPA: alpha/beta fold hydrolase [Thermoleophilaceae bacterium]|nr:alpha/beta fold hydrolase [Thermoleophilaceae bacterium]
MNAGTLSKLQVDDLQLAYREAGSGPPVLLLHGWPTSSFLWRNVMRAIARENRVLALDLPGFGASDKPLGLRYSFEFFARAIDGFLAALDVDEVGLAVHDLGGPVGLHWALDRPERVTKLALLNTLVYPEFSPEVIEFVTALSTPEDRDRITSPEGLAELFRQAGDGLTDEVLAGVLEPFDSDESRWALADAGIGLDPQGFVDIAARLSTLRMPVRIVYGERDGVLPDVAQTMERVRRDLPQAEVTALPHGHFLQEEAPEEVGELLGRFFA